MKSEPISKARKAQSETWRRLKAAYPEDYERIHREERVKLGLDAKTVDEQKGPKACLSCGGPKDRTGKGVRYCTKCKAIKDEEYKKRKREGQKKYIRKPRTKALRRKQYRQRVVKRQATSEIRSAWRFASPNSIIRIKYPTIEKLNAAATRGEIASAEKR